MNRSVRRAPAVRYPLRRSAALGSALGLILLAGGGAGVAWAWQGAYSFTVGVMAAACLWVLVAAAAFHFWQRQWVGMLHWDGQAWALETTTPDGISWALSEPPEVFLDLQTHVWLCATFVGRRRIWVWLERASQPERWLDLRRAVYSRATSGDDNADDNAPASSRVT